MITKKVQMGFAAAAIAASAMMVGCKGKGGFTTLRPGIEYHIYEGKGTTLLQDSSFVKLHIIQKAGDSTFANTYTQNHGEPVLQFLSKESGKDQQGLNYVDIFFKMKEGDSVVIKLNQDSVFKSNKPAFLKKTDEVKVIIKFAEILKGAQRDSLLNLQRQQAAMQGEMQRKQMEEMNKIAPIEDKKIQDYIKAKGIQGANKTQSGIYYAITSNTNNPKPNQGQKVTMNYTGTMLDGTKFDSNVDPAFNHVQPFEFTLGVGQVIPGWDEGVALFPIGSKGVLVIPSYLAYGANPNSPKIKPNSILRFDIEVVNAK
jgi:FKBP-type peptidyl-prolyl cis-trans isomerase FkpA